MTQGNILISGGSGFIGSQCLRFLTERGLACRALVRDVKKAEASLSEWSKGGIFRCDLPTSIDPAAFEGGVSAVIHCAYETRFQDEAHSRSVNEEGTRKVREMTRRCAGARFVFISSMAAHAQARSYYGRSKWQLEQEMDPATDLIIRPGTVLGRGGVFERTREMICKLPVLPLFYGGARRMQTVWIEDLCEAVFQAITKNLAGSFSVAEEEGVSIPDFYRGIAQLDGKTPKILPFPGDFALYSIRFLETFGLRLPITSENLLGIKHLHFFDVREDLRRLGIRARPFAESLRELRSS